MKNLTIINSSNVCVFSNYFAYLQSLFYRCRKLFHLMDILQSIILLLVLLYFWNWHLYFLWISSLKNIENHNLCFGYVGLCSVTLLNMMISSNNILVESVQIIIYKLYHQKTLEKFSWYFMIYGWLHFYC